MPLGEIPGKVYAFDEDWREATVALVSGQHLASKDLGNDAIVYLTSAYMTDATESPSRGLNGVRLNIIKSVFLSLFPIYRVVGSPGRLVSDPTRRVCRDWSE